MFVRVYYSCVRLAALSLSLAVCVGLSTACFTHPHFWDKNVEQAISLFKIPGLAFGMDFVPLKGINHGLISLRLEEKLVVVDNEKFIKSIPIQVEGNGNFVKDSGLGLYDVSFDPEYDNKDNQYIYLVVLTTQCGHDIILRLRYDYLQREILDINEEGLISKDRIIFNREQGGVCAGRTFSVAGRIFFLEDGTMLVSVGAGDGSERLDRFTGKILRMTKDGKPVCNIAGVSDNPFCGEDNEISKYIYSWGHKNSQGLAVDNQGRIFASEHGQQRGDEINLIEAGEHYGYPYLCINCAPYSYKKSVPITYSAYESDPAPLHAILGEQDKDDVESGVYGPGRNRDDPAAFVDTFKKSLHSWLPPKETFTGSAAPSGIAYYPYEGAYRNSLFVGLLAGSNLQRFVIKEDGSLEDKRAIWTTGGRTRDVFVRDAKTIYVLTSPSAPVASQLFKLTLVE